MTARLIVISGTGTEIGKTHLSEALLLSLGRQGVRAVGLKPVESGVDPAAPQDTDAARLHRASSFHVEPFGIGLRLPVSPHRAARAEGVTLPLAALARQIHAAQTHADFVLVELPGGLFTPLDPVALNADFALLLRPDHLLLVAPDRLGVLHDVLAATRAAAACSLPVHGLALIEPAVHDASTGTNAEDLRPYVPAPVLATVPRAPVLSLVEHPSIALIADALRR